jgi:hypothetical protein
LCFDRALRQIAGDPHVHWRRHTRNYSLDRSHRLRTESSLSQFWWLHDGRRYDRSAIQCERPFWEVKARADKAGRRWQLAPYGGSQESSRQIGQIAAVQKIRAYVAALPLGLICRSRDELRQVHVVQDDQRQRTTMSTRWSFSCYRMSLHPELCSSARQSSPRCRRTRGMFTFPNERYICYAIQRI